jgi:hypothetical protein
MTVIENGGRWSWSLEVTPDGNVVARKPIAYDGVLIYSTEDRRNSFRKNSEYRLDEREVIRRFISESDCRSTFGTLVDDVQIALAEVGEA